MGARPHTTHDALWAGHDAEWRHPAEVVAAWESAATVDPQLLRSRVAGPWWDVLANLGATLLVTREYEHLVMAMCVHDDRPLVSYMRLPHPSGLVADRGRGRIFVASTRNPNQIFVFRAAQGVPSPPAADDATCANPLFPAHSVFLPGCLYLHDLALVGGELHANAVGRNTVVRLDDDGSYQDVWWPKCIETPKGLLLARNHIQLNSIAPGIDLASSFFSASTDRPSRLRPGHRRFAVNGRGVVFGGLLREPVCRGLTRPHSVRLHRDRIWVANSGYGELGRVDGERFQPVSKLPGWTRGLCFVGEPDPIAFVGTSRVLPRFHHYAPGLAVDKSICAIHAVDPRTGDVIARLAWPSGNQTFAIDWVPTRCSTGFPFRVGRRPNHTQLVALFHSFRFSDLDWGPGS